MKTGNVSDSVSTEYSLVPQRFHSVSAKKVKTWTSDQNTSTTMDHRMKSAFLMTNSALALPTIGKTEHSHLSHLACDYLTSNQHEISISRLFDFSLLCEYKRLNEKLSLPYNDANSAPPEPHE